MARRQNCFDYGTYVYEESEQSEQQNLQQVQQIGTIAAFILPPVLLGMWLYYKSV